jgi:branched-chain amino acid transport system substrate-binding protein
MHSTVRRSRKATLLAVASVGVLAAACTPKSDPTSTTGAANAGGTTPATAPSLGTPNKANGTSIKIGLVDDGRTEGIDHTPIVAAFNATVSYVNDYLGGLNGHPLEVDECQTKNTPAGGTQCGVQMANDKVAATLVPVSAQDGAVFNALAGTGISYVTWGTGTPDIIAKPGAFVMVNPTGIIAAPAKMAKDQGLDKVGFILIDVPAAQQATIIADPIFKKAGVQLDLISISPQTADMTPQIQQAINNGDKLFTVTGTDEFNANGIKTLKQLGFTGPVMLSTAPTQTVVDGVPGGVEGVIYNTSMTTDPNDKDVQLFNAVYSHYVNDVQPSAQSAWAFALVMSFVKALSGVTDAVDAPSVTKALGSMPKPLDLPMGAGITYQCGAKLVPFTPNVCSSNVLTTTLDAQGNGKTYQLLDVSQYMKLGS